MRKKNFLYAFDDKYAPYAGVSITSLLATNIKNKGEDEVGIFIAGDKISSVNAQKIEQIAGEYKQRINWLKTSAAMEFVNKINSRSWNGSVAMWLKIISLWDLPKEVDRIVYIDSDTLVLDSLDGLFECDMEYPLAMSYNSTGYTRARAAYGLEWYYNSGVILYNMKAIRTDAIRNNFLLFIKEHGSEFADPDQAALNLFFKGNIQLLPLRYNMQGFVGQFRPNVYCRVYKDMIFYDADEIERSMEKPAILHFFRVFGQYPWNVRNMHPYRKIYKIWKDRSLWKDFDDKSKGREGGIFVLQKFLYIILPQLIYLSLFRKVYEYRILRRFKK